MSPSTLVIWSAQPHLHKTLLLLLLPDVTSAWNECVNVSVPTTISSEHASTFWDLGFERLRLKVSAPLTLRRLRLRGIVSAKQPVIHFMFFPGDAGLVCEGCVVEFSCRGLGVDYFNEVLPPDLLHPPPRVSSDNQTIFLNNDVLNTSLSTDVAPGSLCVQNFPNAAFTCSDEDVFSTSAVAPAQAHAPTKGRKPPLNVALAAILPTTAVAILALAGVLYLFVRKRKHASGEQKDPPSSVAQTYSCCSRGGPSCGASGSGRTSATLLTRTTAGGHTVSTRGRPSQEVPDSVFVSLGEDWSHSGSVLPKQDPESRRGSTPQYMPDTESATCTASADQLSRSLSAHLASRTACLDLFRSWNCSGQSGELPFVGSARASKASSPATSSPGSFKTSLTFMEDQASRAPVTVVLSTAGEQAVQVRFIVAEGRAVRQTWVRGAPSCAAADRKFDSRLRHSFPKRRCAFSTITEVNSSAERHAQLSERRTEHVQQEENSMWESIGTSASSASERGVSSRDLQLHAQQSRRSATSVLLSDVVAGAPRGRTVPPSTFVSPSDTPDRSSSGEGGKPGAEAPGTRELGGGERREPQKDDKSSSGALLTSSGQREQAARRNERHAGGVPQEESGGRGNGGGGGAQGSDASGLNHPHVAMHDAQTEPQMHGSDAWGVGAAAPVARAPEEGLRTALAEMEVEEAVLQLHEVVGRGAFGCVYRGTWRGLNVAVKTVAFHTHAGERPQERAIAEAAITFALAHENVVATYSHEFKPLQIAPWGVVEAPTTGARGGIRGGPPPAGKVRTAPPHQGGPCATRDMEARNLFTVQDWKLFLVQEFCEEGSLRQAVKAGMFHHSNGDAILENCVACLRDIARGMEYIQSKKVIHGDLKPSNVLFRCSAASADAKPTALLSQWDAGRNAAAEADAERQPSQQEHLRAGPAGGTTSRMSNRSGVEGSAPEWPYLAKVSDFGLSVKIDEFFGHVSNAHHGTPFYMAPEVTRAGFLSMAADSYSFGVMMWEVLHGAPPYLILSRSSRPVPHPVPSFPCYCPLSFSSLATACLSPEPSSRPNFHQIYHVLDDLYKHLRAPSAESATLAAHVPLHTLQTRTAQLRAAAAAATVDAMHASPADLSTRDSLGTAFPAGFSLFRSLFGCGTIQMPYAESVPAADFSLPPIRTSLQHSSESTGVRGGVRGGHAAQLSLPQSVQLARDSHEDGCPSAPHPHRVRAAVEQIEQANVACGAAVEAEEAAEQPEEKPEEVAKRARIAVFAILARTGTESASSQATEGDPPPDPPANTDEEAQNNRDLALPNGTALLLSMQCAAQASQVMEGAPGAEQTCWRQPCPPHHLHGGHPAHPPLPFYTQFYYPPLPMYAGHPGYHVLSPPGAYGGSGSDPALHPNLLAASNPAFAHMHAHMHAAQGMHGATGAPPYAPLLPSQELQASAQLPAGVAAATAGGGAKRTRADVSSQSGSAMSGTCVNTLQTQTHNGLTDARSQSPNCSGSFTAPSGAVQPPTWCNEPGGRDVSPDVLADLRHQSSRRLLAARSQSPGTASDPAPAGSGGSMNGGRHFAAAPPHHTLPPKRALFASFSEPRNAMRGAADAAVAAQTHAQVRHPSAEAAGSADHRPVEQNVGGIRGGARISSPPAPPGRPALLACAGAGSRSVPTRIGRVHGVQFRRRRAARNAAAAADTTSDTAMPFSQDVASLDARMPASVEQPTPRSSREASGGQLDTPQSPQAGACAAPLMQLPSVLLSQRVDHGADSGTVIGVPVDSSYMTSSPIQSSPRSPPHSAHSAHSAHPAHSAHSPLARAAAAAAAAASAAAAAAADLDAVCGMYASAGFRHSGSQLQVSPSGQSAPPSPREPVAAPQPPAVRAPAPAAAQPSAPLGAADPVADSHTGTSTEGTSGGCSIVTIDYEECECKRLAREAAARLAGVPVPAPAKQERDSASAQLVELSPSVLITSATDSGATTSPPLPDAPPQEDPAPAAGTAAAAAENKPKGARDRVRSSSHYRNKVLEGRWRPVASTAAQVLVDVPSGGSAAESGEGVRGDAGATELADEEDRLTVTFDQGLKNKKSFEESRDGIGATVEGLDLNPNAQCSVSSHVACAVSGAPGAPAVVGSAETAAPQAPLSMPGEDESVFGGGSGGLFSWPVPPRSIGVGDTLRRGANV